jgi:hypothetical protein
MLLADLPGGRAALDTVAADWSPATRERAENSARQSIFRSMSSLLGVVAESAFETVFIQPSENPDWVDSIYIVGKLGMRRLRAGGPITAFGRSSNSTTSPKPPSFRPVLTLDGRCSEDPRAYLLEEFSSQPLPPLQSVRNASFDFMLLPAAVPPINVPVSLVFGQLLERSGSRPRKPGDEPYSETHTPRIPSKTFVFDLLVREDTFDKAPTLTAALQGIVSGGISPDSPDFRRDEVAITANMETLRLGLPDIECTELPNYPDLVDHVFGSVEWDRSRFIGYRCRMRYPVPLVQIGFWIPPGDGDANPRTRGSRNNGRAH